MISLFGNLLLYSAAIVSIATIIYSKLFNIQLNKRYKYSSFFTVAQFLFIFFSYILLTYAYIISDFSIFNVWQNSELNKPLIYKITGVWGNHEGSILLWVLILSFYSFLVVIIDRIIPKNYILNVLFIQSLITLAFLLFIIFTSNPFILQYPVPSDGVGLNSLLQDPGLIIHPPLLYIGYVGFSVVFSYSIAAMLDKDTNSIWALWIRKWVYIAWCSLTLGITIGSWWAYYELGWGGWWFWDPVENASLLPWITGTALMHSLSIFRSSGQHRDWTLLLSILTFSFSLMGTFLVRSGILTSVHSFASDPQRGLWILVIMSFFVIMSFTIFILNLTENNEKTNFYIFKRGTFILFNNYLLMLSCFIVLFGTLYPLILESITSEVITVGPQYFNTVFIPVTILLAILMPLGPNLPWSGKVSTQTINRICMSLIITISLIIILQIIVEGKTFNLNLLIIGLGAWIIINSIVDLLPNNNHSADKNISDIIMFNIKNINIRRAGVRIAHAGFGLLIVGIVTASSYSEQKDLKILNGGIVDINKYVLQYEGLETDIGQNFDDLVLNFKIQSHNKTLGEVLPKKRFFRNSGDITTEAGIFRHNMSHIFITVGEVQESHIYATISYKPLVRFIWLGSFFMVAGLLTSLLIRIYFIKRAHD
jgi:cytochrome c-type biogenesis protein CcmF